MAINRASRRRNPSLIDPRFMKDGVTRDVINGSFASAGNSIEPPQVSAAIVQINCCLGKLRPIMGYANA
jgi:hypothetical protein